MDTAVAERPRHANQTHPAATKALQRAFLNTVQEVGTYGAACRLLGIHRSTVMQWAKKNPTIREKMRQNKEFAEEFIGDEIIGHLHQRALANPKDDPMSAQIAMYITKKIFPAYRENAVTNVNIVGPAAIQFVTAPQPVVSDSHSSHDEP
jgi:hypothetical protein